MAEHGVDENLYAHVEDYHDSSEYSDAERVAIEYAERYLLDHLAIDDDFMNRLRQHFSDADVLDLTICIGNFLAFGRLVQVLKLDQECSIDGRPSGP